jgi:glycine dehydrogenase subunit 1
MSYIPHTEDDVREMLAAIGATSVEDLFDEIPAALRDQRARRASRRRSPRWRSAG